MPLSVPSWINSVDVVIGAAATPVVEGGRIRYGKELEWQRIYHSACCGRRGKSVLLKKALCGKADILTPNPLGGTVKSPSINKIISRGMDFPREGG